MHFNQSLFVLLLVPGPPMNLMLDSPSETEMILRWTPPGEPNGILIGYLLQYQQSEHHLYLTFIHPVHIKKILLLHCSIGDISNKSIM